MAGMPTQRQQRSFLQRNLWPDDEGDDTGFMTAEMSIEAILRRVDGPNAHFKWRVFWVAALGFLTDSYNLFASNVILPALAFVYWSGNSHSKETAFNIATLAASAAGQIVFGFFVDVYGRRSLYGTELMIVIVSTLGLLQCSTGYVDPTTGQHTWNITAWLIFWRLIMGFAIGAEYPLSACIAAEWSSKQSRGLMLSAVFLMQPLGQLLAYIVGVIALSCLGDSKESIDRLWRIVVGFGAIPTLLALLFRRNIPETWRFTNYVRKNPWKANAASLDVYGGTLDAGIEMNPLASVATAGNVPTMPQRTVAPETVDSTRRSSANPEVSTGAANGHAIHRRLVPSRVRGPAEPARPAGQQIPITGSAETTAKLEKPGSQFQWSKLKVHLKQAKNWRPLVGTSITWFLLDFAFYGMGFNSPGTLAKLWTSQYIDFPDNAPWWMTNSDVVNTTVAINSTYPEVTVTNGTYVDGLTSGPYANGAIADGIIHQVLGDNMRHAIYTTSIPAVLGSIAIIIAIHYGLARKTALIGTFMALAFLLAITSGVFGALFHDGNGRAPGGHIGLIVLWILVQFFFSFGPNTLTFIIPAEVFPTRYRCTFYGIAAASGKLGAVVVQVIILAIRDVGNADSDRFRYLLAAFSVCMALGAVVAYFMIPYVQYNLENERLEDLSDDWEAAPKLHVVHADASGNV